ncbi:MAG TPA: dephospho-CoA kinase [Gemmatimonadaceae bacterium]|nr:dephospho-CoA kinase [Gemmatimonadaceae bacterium]
MLHVGLTGNIGSGKSTVARLLAARGAVVLDADAYAREAVAPGTPGLAAVVARFGSGALRPDGTLDRAALGRLVFADPAARHDLEAIVHPEVARRRGAGVAAARAAGADVVVSDVPLLFEAGLAHEFDVVVVVDAPEAARLERLMAARGLSRDEARARIAAQGDAAAKRARADVVIDNAGPPDALGPQVDALWRMLAARAGS